jgi:hypothetical protein
MPDDRQLGLAPLDEKVDHVRGWRAGRLILEYGDYECPYSRQAFHAIELVEQRLGGNVRFAFRHFPLIGIHPHALAAAPAAEAGARQGRFWDMHELGDGICCGLAAGDVMRGCRRRDAGLADPPVAPYGQGDEEGEQAADPGCGGS